MKKRKKTIRIILVIAAVVTSILSFTIYHFFFDINAIEPGEKMFDSTSPSGDYTITAYLNNGGATTDFAVLCVLNEGAKRKNIYWNYPCDSVVIKWIDNDTVSINGVILEDINKDCYDWRRE